MKAFLNDFGQKSGLRTKTTLVSLAFLLVIVAGCGKATTPIPSVAAHQNSTVTPSPAVTTPNTPPQPQTPIASNDSHRQLQLLNRALIHWMIKNHRHPQNFEEFASSADVQIPDPPAGKKYALNSRGFIIFVDNQ